MKSNILQENLKKIFLQVETFDSPNKEGNGAWRQLVIVSIGEAVEYEDLEAIYTDGLELFKITKDWKENYSEENVLDAVMGLAYGLLLNYGLSDQEYINWATRQTTIFKPFLLELAGEAIADKEKEELKKHFYTQNIDVLMPEEELGNGIELLKTPKNNMHEFKILNSYISFSESFEQYKDLDDKIDDISFIRWNTFKNDYLKLVGNKGIKNVFENFEELNKDLFRELHNEILKFLRTNNISATDIKDFSNTYREYIQENNLMMAMEFLKSAVQESIGEGEVTNINWDNEYTRQIDSFFRSMPIGTGITRLATDITKRATLNVAENFAKSILNELRGAAARKSMEIAIRKMLSGEDFLDLMETIFFSIAKIFKEKIFGYFDTAYYDLKDYEVDDNILENIMNSYLGKTDSPILPDDMKTILLRSILSCPFDDVLYTMIYSIYGVESGQLSELARYLGFDTKYEEKAQIIRKVEIEEIASLSVSTPETIDKKLEALLGFDKKYGDGYTEQLKNKLKEKERDLCLLEQMLKEIPRVRTPIDEAFVKGDNDFIWEEGEKGNGYAQHILEKLYRYDLNRYITEYGKVKCNEKETQVLNDLKKRINDGSLLALYIYSETMKSASRTIYDRQLEAMQEENILTIAKKGLAAARFRVGSDLIDREEEKEKKEGYEYFRLAKQARYPRVFYVEALLMLEGKSGYEKDILISEKLFEVSMNFGIDGENWLRIRKSQEDGFTLKFDCTNIYGFEQLLNKRKL